MPYLTQDIRSLMRGEQLYGCRGDPVKIISDSVTVLIVEGPDGNRFPVRKEFVTDQWISDTAVQKNDTTEPDPVPLPTKAAVKKKSAPPSQINLF